jgi:hypothetical protein
MSRYAIASGSVLRNWRYASGENAATGGAEADQGIVPDFIVVAVAFTSSCISCWVGGPNVAKKALANAGWRCCSAAFVANTLEAHVGDPMLGPG